MRLFTGHHAKGLIVFSQGRYSPSLLTALQTVNSRQAIEIASVVNGVRLNTRIGDVSEKNRTGNSPEIRLSGHRSRFYR